MCKKIVTSKARTHHVHQHIHRYNILQYRSATMHCPPYMHHHRSALPFVSPVTSSYIKAPECQSILCITTTGSELQHHITVTNFPSLAPQVNISSLTLANRTASTLSVTWSAGYPKCYSFTVSHSTQEDSITVTQPADSDTSHTLTSLQPGTTYRIEVEAVRKGEGAGGQRAKIIGNFTTDGEGVIMLVYICTKLHHICALL